MNGMCVFRCLASPERRYILGLFLGMGIGGVLTVGEVAGRADLDRFRASRHLRSLRNAGLLGGRYRGTAHEHRLLVGGLDPVRVWLQPFLEVDSESSEGSGAALSR